jgi:hypothetical protein
MTPRGVQRLFADDYSSSGQIAWKEGRRGLGSTFWDQDFLGQLRFDTLVARTLVIPDSHVLDGPYFLRRSPRALAVELGRRSEDGETPMLPFEVRGRGSGLGDTLATLLLREGRDTLNPFVFKTIEDEVLRPLLAEELGRTPVRDLELALTRSEAVATAVAAVLRAALLRIDPTVNVDALIDPLEEGWGRWLAEDRHVRVMTWPVHREFDVARGLAAEPLVESKLMTELGREAFGEVRGVVAAGSEHRADVSALLAGPRASATEAGDGAVLGDLDLVDGWYSRGRYRALARRHGCACVLADQLGLPPLSAGQELLREVMGRDDARVEHVSLPDGVLRRLADMDSDEFRLMIHRHRRGLHAWWTDGETDGLKSVAAAVGDVEVTSGRPRLGVAQLLPAFVTPGVGFVVGRATGDPGFGTFLGAEIGALLTASLATQRTEAERVQARVLEALIDRGRDDLMEEPESGR